jgi:hypothetical protein
LGKLETMYKKNKDVKQCTPTDVSLSAWLTGDINSVFGSLNYVIVGSVAVISGVHALRPKCIYMFVKLL